MQSATALPLISKGKQAVSLRTGHKVGNSRHRNTQQKQLNIENYVTTCINNKATNSRSGKHKYTHNYTQTEPCSGMCIHTHTHTHTHSSLLSDFPQPAPASVRADLFKLVEIRHSRSLLIYLFHFSLVHVHVCPHA